MKPRDVYNNNRYRKTHVRTRYMTASNFEAYQTFPKNDNYGKLNNFPISEHLFQTVPAIIE